ncbi:MAG: hypothetical protein ABSD88_18580 [Candidatus Korobacteraceae bacterium]
MHPGKIVSLALVVSVLISGVCAEQQFADFQPLAASQYPSYQEHQGIGIAVVPVFDVSSQNRYLGINLLGRGFLPIYIVIENHSNLQGAILLRDEVLYSHDDSAAVRRSEQQARPSPSGARWAMAEGGIPGRIVALHWLSKMSDVRMNLLKKELQSQTVAPGKAGGGFVFAPIGKGSKAAKEVLLDVPMRSTSSNESIHFYFGIDVNSGKK